MIKLDKYVGLLNEYVRELEYEDKMHFFAMDNPPKVVLVYEASNKLSVLCQANFIYHNIKKFTEKQIEKLQGIK